MKNVKKIEEVQDRYAILKEHQSLSSILSLGYIDFIDDEEIKFKQLSVDERNTILLVRDFLSIVISEAMKSKEERNENKIVMFLKLAMEMSDNYYASNPCVLLFHSLTPPKD